MKFIRHTAIALLGLGIASIRNFQTLWQAINVGQSIELGWNQKFPSKSLNLDRECLNYADG